MDIAGQAVSEETVAETTASVGVVVAFLVGLLVVGITYGHGNGGHVAGLEPTGGIALVGVIAGFVLLVTVVGVWLAVR